MTRQSIISAFALSAVLLLGQGEAFTPQSHSASMKRSSALHLLPDQGNQLIAAYNALSEAQRKEIKATKAPIEVSREIRVVGEASPKGKWRTTTIAASKNLLSKIFQGPSVLHPLERKSEDICYYPMVGFRFVEGVDNALPTKSSASCVVPTRNQREEEVFGWFSSSCKLDVFSEDVCVNPIGKDE
eukprot:CAMPEP_0172365584 /NCGR_PEP_ID=MMETSP1060-20121228/10524_1 /TAXON_ID=37318 /ORGANISM="Pseudo-nitzschia pungens, Strain cf. cingulata" /LENGTH=185 /DNA_ID=CAMNT_0013088947 /DNA_START=98 /DNA_END=655 /DNA_ORIENTATION=-